MNSSLKFVIDWMWVKLYPDEMEVMLTRGSVNFQVDVQLVSDNVSDTIKVQHLRYFRTQYCS